MMEKLETHRRGGEEENGKRLAEGKRKQNPTTRPRNSGEGGGRCQGLWVFFLGGRGGGGGVGRQWPCVM
jgi:hypothetical protein